MKNVQVNQLSLTKILFKNHYKFYSWFSISNTKTSAISNPIIKYTETTESLSPLKVTETSLPIGSTLRSSISIPLQILIKPFNRPLQIPKKIICSYSDIHKGPNTTRKCASQNTATLSFPRTDKTQKKLPRKIPFTEFLNQFQKNPAVTIQPNISIDHTFLLKTQNNNCSDFVRTYIGFGDLC